MSRVTVSTDFERLELEEIQRFLTLYAEQIARILTNGLDFETNFNCKIVGAVFTTVDNDTAVTHGLERVPVGYIVYSRTTSAIVYNGSATWTNSTMYLKASAVGTISMIVF